MNLIALALLLLAQPSAKQANLQAATPDLAIFVLDDIASADLSLYGGPVQTPALAALAQQGVLFTRCYANPTCGPTRRTILTGQWWVSENGAACEAWDPLFSPSLSETLIPEALPGRASWILGKWHLGGDPNGGPWECAPVSHGFDGWSAGMGANVKNCGGASYNNWMRADQCSSAQELFYEPIAVREEFLQLWPSLRAPRVFYVAGQLAHGPFHVPPASLLPPNSPPPFGMRGQYEYMIVAGDKILEQCLAAIDLSRTLVIVVGDNGTPEQVAPNPGKAKTTTFERGVRVPLVIAGHGVEPGHVSDELVHTVDLWRTAIAGVDGSAPAGGDSRSLVPILKGKAFSSRDFVLCGTGWGTPGGDVAAVSAHAKLRWLDADGDEVAETREFYDLLGDPNETVNLIASPAWQYDVAAHEAFLAGAIP